MKANDRPHKPISTRTHGILDYILGPVLILAPNLFGFAHLDDAATWALRAIGIVALCQTLITRFELGAIKLMPMRLHLMNDYVAGAFLAASPWLLRFYDPANQRLWVPHVVAGLGIILVTALTQKVPRSIDADGQRAAHA